MLFTLFVLYMTQKIYYCATLQKKINGVTFYLFLITKEYYHSVRFGVKVLIIPKCLLLTLSMSFLCHVSHSVCFLFSDWLHQPFFKFRSMFWKIGK